MATDVGARITLAGEKEFRNALSQINTGLKMTASELALVTARFSDNATSVKALTERGKVLESQISGQREKIEKLREALTNATNTYGNADKRTINWQISLNKAETELIQMESALKQNSEALKKATNDMEKYGLKEDEVTEQTRGFGDVLSNVINSLGIQLPAGAEKAIQALDGQKASTMALIGISAGLATGFAKSTMASADFADELLEMSSQTGLTTDTLQELKYAAEFVDVPLETMTGSMARMIRSMDDARSGSKDASNAFRELGLRVTDSFGNLKDSEQMFYDVIDALGRMGNETERDAISMQIFGRSAQELNPLIEAGSGRLKELSEEAQRLGIVMSPENIGKLSDLKDEMDKLNAQTGAFKMTLGLALLPVLKSLFEILNMVNPKVLATVAIIGTIAVVAVTVVKAVGSITTTFSAMNPVTLKTTAIIVGITAALIALAAIIAVIIGKGDELNHTMGNIGDSVGNMTNTVNNAGNRLNIGRNALGTSNWRGGWTWVGEEGPELVYYPSGTRILNNKQSMQMVMAGAGGNGDIYIQNFNVEAKDLDEMSKVTKVFNNLRQVSRKGVHRI